MSMLTGPFYHQLLRKYHIAFGSLFTNLTIVRNDTDGKELQRIVLPIEYAPREAWVTRLREDPNIKQQYSSILPRLAYEMTGLRYDPTRKLNSLNSRVRPMAGDPTNAQRFFVGVPYIITFSLYGLSRSVEDANQMMEQIIPYFTPDYTMTVKTLPSLGIQDRMRIVMDGTPQWTDDWMEAGFQRTRDIILTWTFNVAAMFYGPISSTPANIIRKVIVDLYETPYDATLTDVAYLMTPNWERLLEEDGSGRLLDESNVSSLTGDVMKWAEIVVTPDPPNAAPVKPVETITTITEYGQ